MNSHKTYLRTKQCEEKPHKNLFIYIAKYLPLNRLMLLLILGITLNTSYFLPTSISFASCNISLGNMFTFNAKIEFN